MKNLIILVLFTLSASAHSAVLCQSLNDPNFRAWYEGYTCPAGYYLIKIK